MKQFSLEVWTIYMCRAGFKPDQAVFGKDVGVGGSHEFSAQKMNK